jgi:hypothetical protein
VWIERAPVASTSISSIGYAGEQRTLEIEFRDGAIYRYFLVPAATYRALVTATSVGAAFNRMIRPCFPSRLVAPAISRGRAS